MMLTNEETSALILSVQVAVASVLLSVVPAIGCAWLLARGRFVGRSVVDAVLHLPLVLPPVAVGYTLLLLLGRQSTVGGWLHERLGLDLAFTWKAAAIAAAVMGFPLMLRSVRLAMELVDVRTEQAARTLGAGPLRVFLTITLPLSFPGLLTGIVLAFARSLGEFGATITFAGNIEGVTRTLPAAIYTFSQVPGGEGPALRLMMISAGLSLAALLVSQYLSKRVAAFTGNAA